ncbi:MAG: hypothetical protein NC350_02320 [Corallococcus sp.]|nr:hypothetical protein [Corallococcus sp.]
MRKTIEKVALIAYICVTCVFVLISLLSFFGIFGTEELLTSPLETVIVIVLAVVYAGLTVYLVYANFSQRNALRYVMLYSDADSSASASIKVVKNIAAENSRLVDGIHIKKIRVSSDDKLGFKLKMFVETSTDSVYANLDTLRCLCRDSYANVLGLHFSVIDFQIDKMTGVYKPDIEKARLQAKVMSADRKFNRDCYNEPVADVSDDGISVEIEKNAPTDVSEKNTQNKVFSEDNNGGTIENDAEPSDSSQTDD